MKWKMKVQELNQKEYERKIKLNSVGKINEIMNKGYETMTMV
jgi:hypothetical protein